MFWDESRLWKLEGDEGGGGGLSDADVAIPATPTPQPEPTPTPVVEVETPQEWDDIRDVAKNAGLDLSHIPDSQAAAKYLIDLARAKNSYLQYGQQLAPHYSEFQEFLKGKQAKAPVVETKPANPFALPEYDPRWMDMIQRDAAGNLVPGPGAPPDIVGKATAYHRALKESQENFFRDPQKYLDQMIQAKVQPMLEQHVQQNLSQYQEKVAAEEFIRQNTQWLHQRTAQGEIVTDPITRMPVLSPDGQKFLGHLREAERMGVKGMADQQGYATKMLQLDKLGTQGALATAVQGGDAKKDAFLQQFNRKANQGGSTTPPTNPNRLDASQNSSLSLAERLRADLKANGITDDMVAGNHSN